MKVGKRSRKYISLLNNEYGGRVFPAMRALKTEPTSILAEVFDAANDEAADLLNVRYRPTKYSEFRISAMSPAAPTLEAEIRWTAFAIGRAASDVDRFFGLRSAFERAFLLGDYADAAKIVTDVDRALGLSFWSIEAQLRLGGAVGGLREIRRILSHLNKRGLSRGSFLLSQLTAQRLEPELSAQQYYREARRTIEGISDEVFHPWLYYRASAHLVQGAHPLSFVLWREQNLALPDRLVSFLRICQMARVVAKSDLQKAAQSIETIVPLASSEPRIALLLQSLLPSRIVAPIHAEYDAAGARFIAGSYSHAALLSERLLRSEPDAIEHYLLHIKSQLCLGRTPLNPFAAGTTAHRVYGALSGAMQRTGAFQSSIADLLKLSLELESSPLGAQLHSWALKESGVDRVWTSPTLLRLNDGHITAGFCECFETDAQRLGYLTQCGGLFAREAIDLYSAQPSQTTTTRHDVQAAHCAIHDGRRSERAGLFQRAVDDYTRALRLGRGSRVILTEATKGQFRTLMALNRLAEAADLVVFSRIHDPELILALPVRDLYLALNRSPDILKGTFQRVVLTHYAEIELPNGERDWQILHAALDDLLSDQAVSLPSELMRNATSHDPQALAYLFRNICVNETLEYSLAVHGSDDLDNERISLCQALVSLDPARAEAYQREIRQRTQNSAIRHALVELDKSKIFVDRNGISRQLERTLAEQFVRFRAYSSLDEHLRSQLLAKGYDLSESKNVVVFSDSGFLQFEILFNEIKSLFISSNEFGLDSYLSVRIRHGTLSGQLRSAFEVAGLVTKHDTRGQYQSNAMWAARLAGDPESGLSSLVDECLKEFSREVDETIKWIRDDALRIKGDAHPNGLFDYEYENQEMVQLWYSATKINTYEEFVGWAIDCLWKRTDTNLRTVVDQIRSQFRARINGNIDSLRVSLRSLPELQDQSFHADIEHAIVRTGTAVSNAIENVASWFSAPEERRVPPFTIELLMRTSEESVRKCHRQTKFNLDDANATQLQKRFSGTLFAAFVDAMFILLENAARHSGYDDVHVAVACMETSNMLEISVANPVNQATDEDAVRTAITKYYSSLRDAVDSSAVRREGGSGFTKLQKIIRYDLARGDEYSVDVEYSNSTFTVKLRFSLDGMLEGDEHAHSYS